MDSYLNVMHPIHVLVVDHDREALMHTVNLLQMCQYQVTFVELASVAISMLSRGNVKFDIVMANMNSPDLYGFKLLEQAVNMNLLIILMSLDDHPFMVIRAIENGAYMYVKKPVTLEMLRCLWQHVIVDGKTRPVIMSERDRLMMDGYNARDFDPRVEENLIGINGARSMNNNNRVRRRSCTEWTKELHDKFMAVVEELGEGKCFPKEIQEKMNVPGLTRMQVSSHLQKCRNDKWRTPEERKSQIPYQPIPSDTNAPNYKPRGFGSMPRLGNTSSNKVRKTSSEGRGGSQTQYRTGTENDGGLENTATNLTVANTVPINHQHYGQLVTYPNNVTTSVGTNPRNPFDDFTYIDSFIHNYACLPQGCGTNHACSSSGGNRDNANSTMGSTKTAGGSSGADENGAEATGGR